MRVRPFVLGLALVVSGCAAAPTQPAPQQFETKFLNLASIANQIANMTNVNVNTQVAVPIAIAPVTQINALGYGNQDAIALPSALTDQGMNLDISQLMDQFGATL